jgi:hypothetical protein
LRTPESATALILPADVEVIVIFTVCCMASVTNSRVVPAVIACWRTPNVVFHNTVMAFPLLWVVQDCVVEASDEGSTVDEVVPSVLEEVVFVPEVGIVSVTKVLEEVDGVGVVTTEEELAAVVACCTEMESIIELK